MFHLEEIPFISQILATRIFITRVFSKISIECYVPPKCGDYLIMTTFREVEVKNFEGRGACF